MPILKLTKSSVEKLEFSGTRVDYYDTDLKGFGLRVGASSKSFFARKEINGEPARQTIGKYGVWTAEQAREKARKLLHQMDEGIDPRLLKKQSEDESRTVDEWFAHYFTHKKLKPTTIRTYGFARNLYLVSWKDRPLYGITRADVLKLHREISAAAGGPAASLAMIAFRALWNYAHLHLEDPPSSPTRVLTAADEWAPKRRRSDRLLPAQIPEFVQAIKFLRSAQEDAFSMVLHTGMRSEEVAGLLRKNVYLDRKFYVIPDTKNGTDLVLPMSTPIYDMLKRRIEAQDGSEFAFKGQGKGGNIKLQASTLKRLGFEVTVHGLRRTFRSLCESLHFPTATIKALMNHSLEADITDSYLDMPVEILRPYAEQISAEIARLVAG